MTEDTHKVGGCSCRQVRYKMKAEPMFIHCCHCTWCQRASGSAFALNALIESDEIELLAGEVEIVDTPTNSGSVQKFARCRECRDTLWSHYNVTNIGDAMSFVRIGTLDQPHQYSPSVHIFTSTKQPWVRLDNTVPVFENYYDISRQWPQASLARRAALEKTASG